MSEREKVQDVAESTLIGERRAKETPAAPPGGGPRGLSAEEVLTLLEEDQLFAAKKKPFGRVRLSRSQVVLLWGLRAYVVFMWVVVVVAVLQSLHGS
jgi:hypothetical protein